MAILVNARGVQAMESSDDVITARFLYQLLRYVSWPDSAGTESREPFVVAVLGDESFATVMREVVGDKRAQGRAIEVRAVAENAVSEFHLISVRGRDPAQLRQFARTYHGQPVLTSADHFGFPEYGGDVGLEIVEDRVRFSISRRKTIRGDFAISSKLLRVASEVQ
jgi:hypothetical protein